MSARISLIIPFFNEEEDIESLLQELNGQSLRPDEVILIDSGSKDRSLKIIEEIRRTLDFELKVVQNPDPSNVWLPGHSRNEGVKLATGDVIGFLDVGIKVDKFWLENQIHSDSFRESGGVLGRCQFLPSGVFATVFCGLSLGVGSLSSTLPGAVIEREKLRQLDPFRGNLRAGEDLLWKESFRKNLGHQKMGDGLIIYNSFQNNILGNMKKWFYYSRSLIGLNELKLHRLAYVIFFPALLISLVCPPIAAFILIVYLVGRGILDPIRRSHDFFWFSKEPIAFFLAIPLCFFLDLSKFFGFVAGYFSD